MSEFAQHAVVIDLLRRMEDAGSWCGETHLQKSVYLLKYGLDMEELPFEFVMYKHGPYSFGLHDEVGTLLSMGLIEAVPRSGYGSALYPTELGLKITSRFPSTVERYAAKLQAVADQFSNRTATVLERVATALFVVKEHPDAAFPERLTRFMELKPYLPSQSAELGFHELEDGLKQIQAKSN